jgi:YegS/Rv2252/BmrU family lipid kinase
MAAPIHEPCTLPAADHPSEAGKTVAVVNPMASNGAAEKRWQQLEEAVRVHFPGLEVRMTEAPGHASALTREALEAGAHTILSVGGDGTNNEILRGFVDEHGRNRFPEATLAVLAVGTGGDFQRMFGRVKARQQLERLCTAPTRRIDYGVAHYLDHEGRPGMRPFLNVASVGVSGEVVRRVNGSGSNLGPTMKYLVGTLKGISGWHNVQVFVEHDEEIEAEEKHGRVDLTLGIVGNGQYFGAGMWVCPNATIDDGKFDCVEVTGMSRSKLTATLAKVFKGKHLRTKGIAHHHATRVAYTPVDPSAKVPIEVDGEQVGFLPARFELQAGALGVRIS